MKPLIKDAIVIILLLIIILQKCTPSINKPTIQHFRDTTLVKLSGDTSITKIMPTKVIPYVYKSVDTIYIPDTINKTNLIAQYYSLRDSLLATKIYEDTFKIATLGEAHVNTTIHNNSIISQKFNYNIKYPVIKDCVIIQAPLKNQVYFGIGVQGNQIDLVNHINAHLLFKNKKENILGIQAGITNEGKINYGVNTFWKIKF